MKKNLLILFIFVLLCANSAYSEMMTFSSSQDLNGNLWFDFYELKNSQIISADITISLKSEEKFNHINFVDEIESLYKVHYYKFEQAYVQDIYTSFYDQYLYLDDSKISFNADYIEDDGAYEYSSGENITKFQIFGFESPVEINNPRGEIMQKMESINSNLSETEFLNSYYYLLFRNPLLYGTHDISYYLQSFIDLNEFANQESFSSQLLIDNLHYYTVDQASVFVEFVRSDAQLASVPEPASFALLGMGLMIALAGMRRRDLERI